MTTRGRFITLEGVDGAGKSSHLQWLANDIRAHGHDVLVTREPGGTALGESLRELLLKAPMHAETEAMLMFAARREHVANLIEPALGAGQWVLCDRFSDASFAYQGAAKGVAWQKLIELEDWVHKGLSPDLTFLFDLAGATAKERLAGAREPDKFEREAATFFEKVRVGYRRRMDEHAGRFRMIDGGQPIEQVRRDIQAVMEDFYRKSEIPVI
jgi:dTMP kinase